MKEEIKSSDRLKKAETGICGFDDLTDGGLPEGRPALVIGAAGAGKTVFAMEFLIKGAVEFDAPGVFISFEENEQELEQNFSSLGYNLRGLIEEKKLAIDYLHIDRNEIEETGEYDLEGLFLRISHAVSVTGAKRVVLDTLEALFAGFQCESILRAELRRLFRWLKEKGLTAVITAEKGKETLTRFGIEEYVADCVLLLDHRVENQISTRRLRIIKYRGSSHGTDEYPFLISPGGIFVIPLSSMSLDYKASGERFSSGIGGFDALLKSGGLIKGNSILLSGPAGAGKTSICAGFAAGSVARGQKCLFFSFEESVSQLSDSMARIGYDFSEGIKKDLIRFICLWPAASGLEVHLERLIQQVREYSPDMVVIDPISSLTVTGSPFHIKSMMMRLIHLLKNRQATTIYSRLDRHPEEAKSIATDIVSITDTWVKLNNREEGDNLSRQLRIVKSRGTNHSRAAVPYKITENGVRVGEEI